MTNKSQAFFGAVLFISKYSSFFILFIYIKSNFYWISLFSTYWPYTLFRKWYFSFLCNSLNTSIIQGQDTADPESRNGYAYTGRDQSQYRNLWRKTQTAYHCVERHYLQLHFRLGWTWFCGNSSRACNRADKVHPDDVWQLSGSCLLQSVNAVKEKALRSAYG